MRANGLETQRLTDVVAQSFSLRERVARRIWSGDAPAGGEPVEPVAGSERRISDTRRASFARPMEARGRRIPIGRAGDRFRPGRSDTPATAPDPFFVAIRRIFCSEKRHVASYPWHPSPAVRLPCARGSALAA